MFVKDSVISWLYFSGVKATYLLAVAFLEIIRFSSNGGLLNCSPGSTASRSAFSCAFEYLKSPNLVPAVFQCLMAMVHRAFETALSWLVILYILVVEHSLNNMIPKLSKLKCS